MHDSADTFSYIDPPYPFSTRDRGEDYRHEMSDDDHMAMAACIKGLKGNWIVSGYDCDLYRDLFAGFRRIDKTALADGARERTESLWLSPGVCDGPLLQWGAA